MEGANRIWVAVPVALLVVTCWQVAPAAAALADELAYAVAHDRPDIARAEVVEAIAARPVDVEAIIAQAVAAAPAFADTIVAGAVAAFPGFASRIRQAASPGGGSTATATPAPAATPAVAAATLNAIEPAAAPPNPPPAPPPSSWSGEIALGGGNNTGNTETTDANASVKALYKDERWEHELDARFNYAAENGNSTARRWVASYQPRYNINQRLYGFGFVEYDDDAFSGFDYQVSESAGLGYRVVLPPPVSLALEAGPGARHSRESATGDTENEITGRFVAKFAWQISDTAKLTNDTSVTVGSERTLTTNTSALTADVIGHVAARISLEIRNNSNPPDDKKATDTASKISLVYGF